MDKHTNTDASQGSHELSERLFENGEQHTLTELNTRVIYPRIS